MDDIPHNLATVRQRLEHACARAGRPASAVRLVVVSKSWPAEAIAAAAAAGQRDFGESYLQEALPKLDALRSTGLCWHHIGPIQSNKTRELAAHFDWAQGVDRTRIAERLSAQRPETLHALNVCIQVNISGEASKSGCLPEQAPTLCAAIAPLPRLCLRGLMAIPRADDDPAQSRPAFRQLRQLFEQIRVGGSVDAAHFDTLSMGMSDDFEVAIEEGATLVRVGTAVFGQREG